MDRLELAQAWYARVVPRPGEDLEAGHSDELERWLAEADCPVTEDLARNEAFRQLARWAPPPRDEPPPAEDAGQKGAGRKARRQG